MEQSNVAEFNVIGSGIAARTNTIAKQKPRLKTSVDIHTTQAKQRNKSKFRLMSSPDGMRVDFASQRLEKDLN